MRSHRLDKKGIDYSAPAFRSPHTRHQKATHHPITFPYTRRIVQVTRHLNRIGDILPAIVSLCKGPAARRQRTHYLRELIEPSLARRVELILLLTHLTRIAEQVHAHRIRLLSNLRCAARPSLALIDRRATSRELERVYLRRQRLHCTRRKLSRIRNRTLTLLLSSLTCAT